MRGFINFCYFTKIIKIKNVQCWFFFHYVSIISMQNIEDINSECIMIIIIFQTSIISLLNNKQKKTFKLYKY